MTNLLKKDDDKLGKVIKNVNKMIIISELIGASILFWFLGYLFLDCGGL